MRRQYNGGRCPVLKNRVKAMHRRNEIVGMVVQGLPVTEIAAKLGISKHTVRKHMHVALASGENFPSNLTPETINGLRQTEAEGLSRVKVKLHAALNAVEVCDAVAVARLGESYAKISERLCKLLGLDAPLKVLEAKLLRLETVRGEDNVVKFNWDQEALECDYRTVPGLTVNGVASAAALAQETESDSEGENDEHTPSAAA
jgi:hypothetical protein